MSFFDLFDSRVKKKRLSHIKNLIALACIDGSFDTDEMALIFNIGHKNGLPVEELRRILQDPSSINFFPPESYHERIEQLYDMVLIMMVDGEIHKNEITFCKVTAMRLGFRHEIVDDMVHNTIQLIVDGIATEIALARLLSLAESK